MPNNVDVISKVQQANLYFANLMNEYVDSFVFSMEQNEQLNHKINELYELLEAIQYQLAKGLYYDNEITKLLYEKIDCLTPIYDTVIVIDNSLIEPSISNIPVVYGIGIPAGGSTGQFLVKASNADYDVEWADIDLSGYVPYTGATGAVDLGAYDLTVNGLKVGRGGGNLNTNTLVGNTSLQNNTTGGFNSVFGFNSMTANTSGFGNTSVGAVSLQGNTTGYYNTAVGNESLRYNTSGQQNTAFGYKSLNSNTIGDLNVALGDQALIGNVDGGSNTAIGSSAGAYITPGSLPNTSSNRGVYLGHFTLASSSSATNEIVIGASAVGSGSNTVTIGDNTITDNYFKGNVRGDAFIKTGGLSTQFLKADGSIDSTTYLSSAVLSDYVLNTTTLTINGTTYDLSANRSWTIPTHDAVTIGTANGLSLSGQQLSLGLASGSSTGALSSTDWTTFNNKISGSGTNNYLPIFNSSNSLTNSIFEQIGNAIHLTNLGNSYASFGIINPGTPGDPGVDNDAYIGSTINNDFTFRVNNTEAGRFDTALRFKITNIPNATTDTDKFLVSDGNIIKYRTGAELLSDIGAASSAGFVPYTGATANLDLGTHNLLSNAIILDPTPATVPTAQGSMYFDTDNQTIAAILNGSTMKIGEDLFFQVKNQSGSPIPKGTALRFDGVVGMSGRVKAVPFLADGTYPSIYFLGVAYEDIPNGGDGKALYFGNVRGVNTNAYPAGTVLYASTTVAGGYQTNAPTAPNNIISVAAVVTQGKSNGQLLVRPLIGSNINNDEGVLINTPITGDLLQLQSDGLWKNKSVASLGLVPQSRQLTINGTSYDLSADRSWSVGTITSLTGEATASGTGAVSVTLDNTAVTSKVLTGLNITGGTVVATDSILQAFGKIQNELNGLIGGSVYQGTWNASTNTPTLTSSVGTRGHYYIVSVAGTTNLNGVTDWQIGDWAIFDGSAWQKVDNTDAVVTVNGYSGAVSLVTGDILEGAGTLPGRPSQLYFTDARARLALSFAAGSGAYDSSTGIITIPTNTNQLTNGANYITLGSLSATSPLAYNNLTGAFTIQQANSSQDGYLSSTDWNTFNNKVSTATLAGYVPYTGATGAVNLGAYDLTVNGINIGKGGGAISSNTRIGDGALFSNTTGSQNIAIGQYALYNNTTGQYNTAIGGNALNSNTTAIYNTGVGFNALVNNTTGYNNTGVGLSILVNNTTGYNNSALGLSALGTNTTGHSNSALGSNAGTYTNAGDLNQTSNNSVYLGYDTRASASGNFNEIVIGSLGRGLGPNTIAIGNSSTSFGRWWGNLLLGNSTNSGEPLQVTGNAKITGTINNGTYTYTLPSATGTLALTSNITSAISGTTNYLPKFTGANTIGNSLVYDNGTNVGINTATPASFSGYNTLTINGTSGSAFVTMASNIQGIRLISSSSDAAIWEPRNVPVLFGVNNSEQMRLNASGNLSIGNTNDTYKLDVSGASSSDAFMIVSGGFGLTKGGIYLGNDGTQYGSLWFDNANNNVVLSQNYVNGNLTFGTNSTERMRITSGGNVLIGTTTDAGYKLDVNGTGRFSSNLTIGTSNTSSEFSIRATDVATNMNYLSFGTNTYNRAQIQVGGSALTDGYMRFYTFNAGSGVLALTLASTGAATFSSSVTAGGVIRALGGNIDGTLGDAIYFENSGYPGTQKNRIRSSNSASNTGNLLVFETNNGTVGSYNTNQLVLRGDGNVGIGTTSPTDKLNVAGSGNFGITLSNSGNSGTDYNALRFSHASNEKAVIFTNSDNLFLSTASGFLSLQTSTTERMRITSGGYLKLREAVTSTTAVHILQADTTSDAVVQVRNLNTSTTSDGMLAVVAERNTTNNTFYALGYYNIGAGAWKFRVADSGNVTNTNNSYGGISDISLKENISDTTSKLADLLKVKVRNYNLIGDDKKQIGVIAQELETIFPSMIDTDSITGLKSVKYSVFVPMLIKGLQELKAEIDLLKNK